MRTNNLIRTNNENILEKVRASTGYPVDKNTFLPLAGKLQNGSHNIRGGGYSVTEADVTEVIEMDKGDTVVFNPTLFKTGVSSKEIYKTVSDLGEDKLEFIRLNIGKKFIIAQAPDSDAEVKIKAENGDVIYTVALSRSESENSYFNICWLLPADYKVAVTAICTSEDDYLL